MAKNDSPGTIIEANAFVLKDSEGRKRASLEIDEDGSPALCLFNENGAMQVLVGLGATGAGINLFDNEGNKKVELVWSPQLQALGFYGDVGHLKTALVQYPDGDAHLSFVNEEGHVHAMMGSAEGESLFHAGYRVPSTDTKFSNVGESEEES